VIVLIAVYLLMTTDVKMDNTNGTLLGLSVCTSTLKRKSGSGPSQGG